MYMYILISVHCAGEYSQHNDQGHNARPVCAGPGGLLVPDTGKHTHRELVWGGNQFRGKEKERKKGNEFMYMYMYIVYYI